MPRGFRNASHRNKKAFAMFIKVCGLTSREQIDHAIEYGYDAIGVVTYANSKRYCPPAKAEALADYARGRIKRFVVGLTYSDVAAAVHAFDYTQIYEPKQVPNLVLSSTAAPPDNLDYEYFIYDASIGSGAFTAFPAWIKDRSDRILVAGGLDKTNVCQVIRDLRPYGVDVSSGVEKDGVKDPAMMKALIDTARSCT